MIPPLVLQAYGFDETCQVQVFGSGHIHKTFKISNGEKNFILQRINKFVFKKPELITRNIRLASQYLATHHPHYLFLYFIKTRDGADTITDNEGYPWRLFPFIENTVTINEISSTTQAYEAAKGFGEFAKNLGGCDPAKFARPIERFHDLSLRYEQFEAAMQQTSAERLRLADTAVTLSKQFRYLVDQYGKLISGKSLKLRITHNDTKINNILFDTTTHKAVCVIDLDTLMPGYFIYDLGDMVRTFVSPASEAERDHSRVVFRKEIYDALVEGYLSEMSEELSAEEKAAIPFSGMMMTYIIGLRFLTDFLNGDVYFSTSYPLQNLDRAKNQLTLLEILRDQFRA